MAVAALRPSVLEQVGVSCNATTLKASEGRETDVDRVAALGAASLVVQLGADRDECSIFGSFKLAADRDERDRISGELGALLIRIKVGQQHALIPQAVHLLRQYMALMQMFAEYDQLTRSLLIEPFAPHVLHEWLTDRCTRCGGTGLLERQGANLVRGRGSMQRNAVFHACDTCHGKKRMPANHVERARALGIPKRWYYDIGWPSRFSAARSWLDQVARRIQRPLTQELGRRIRAPSVA